MSFRFYKLLTCPEGRMKDTYIKKFDSVYGSEDSYYGIELRSEFTDYFKEKNINGFCALDLGCGEGRYSLFLAQKGCHVFSADRSSAGIRKLKTTAEMHQLPIRAEVIDIENFVFEENRFDIIIAATVLDHLYGQLRQTTINGIKKSLKPGGILYVNVFTVSDPGYKAKISAASQSSPENISDTAECMEYYFEENELKGVFGNLNILYYYEGVELDVSHGRPHDHGWACLLAEKPAETV